MHPKPRTTISAYLAKPRTPAYRQRRWSGFRTQMVQMHRYNPGIAKRTCAALLLWGAFGWGIQSLAHAQFSPHQPFTVLSSTSPNKRTVVASLASGTHTETLPGGPNGAVLPPGTLAPDRTYANNYTWGNCTWYVASRRPVPSGWGNASSWYYNAISSGWSVGTVPALGAIAWTGAGWSGHVALVEQVSSDNRQVYISEMNYRGLDVKSFRWAYASSFKYIY